MNFNLEDKIQLVKWHFGGKSLQETAELFTSTYGRLRTKKAVYRVIYLFQRRGCLVTTCKKCSSVRNKIEMQDDDNVEALETMVCAAAELELSNRDIAIELGIYPHKVAKILKKHGYGTVDSEDSEEDEFGDIKRPELRSSAELNKPLEEAHWEEKNQIVVWSLEGHMPSAISRLFATTFKHGKPTRAWVRHIIHIFDKHGCIRDCKQCVGTIFKPIDIADTSEEDSEVEEAPVDVNGKMKVEEHPTEIVFACTSVKNADIKNAESISKAESAEEACITKTNNKRLHSSANRQGVEFISVKPTMDIIVVGKLKSMKKKKKEVD